MEETLDQKIKYLTEFFKYFYLNKENFSKNIQLQLNLLKPKLKFQKDLLTTTEKDKLIFIQSNNINEIICNTNSTPNNPTNDTVCLKKLDLLYSIAKKINLDLKFNKEKMSNSYKADDIAFEKEIKEINFDMLLNDFEEKFGKFNKSGLISNKNINPSFITNENLKNSIKEIEKQKSEINEIIAKNEQLDMILLDLEQQLKAYKDLPTDINQIRTLVEIKKEEYKNLNNSKKK